MAIIGVQARPQAPQPSTIDKIGKVFDIAQSVGNIGSSIKSIASSTVSISSNPMERRLYGDPRE